MKLCKEMEIVLTRRTCNRFRESLAVDGVSLINRCGLEHACLSVHGSVSMGSLAQLMFLDKKPYVLHPPPQVH